MIILGVILTLIAMTIFVSAYILRKHDSVILTYRKELPFILRLFAGLSSFIYDRIKALFPSIDSNIHDKFMKLYPLEDTSHKEHIYIIKAISTTITFLSLMLIILSAFSYTYKECSPVTEIERPGPNESPSEIPIDIQTEDGTSSPIIVTVEPQSLSFEDTLNIFTDNRDAIMEKMLGENSSCYYVDEPLTFFDTYGEERIKITWIPEDSSLISLNGDIKYENVPPDGISTNLDAKLTLSGNTAIMTFTLMLQPKPISKISSIENEIDLFINDEAKLSNSAILLPEKLSFGNISFSKANTSYLGYLSIIGIVASILILVNYGYKLNKRINERSKELTSDYPQLVSKLTLLCGTGMSIKNCFKYIVTEYQVQNNSRRYVYEEMKETVIQMDNGYSESDTYLSFGHRCHLPCYIKLGSILEQNIKKGTSEMRKILSYEVENSYNEYRSLVKINAEKMSTKLMFPMMLMFISIIIMIVYPAFAKI